MRALGLLGAGFAAGMAAGMGLGGGTLLVPALTLLFGLPLRQAQGVCLLSFLPGAAAALYVHSRAGRLKKAGGPWLAASGAAGAALGALLGGALRVGALKKLFGIFMVSLALSRLRGISGGGGR